MIAALKEVLSLRRGGGGVPNSCVCVALGWLLSRRDSVNSGEGVATLLRGTSHIYGIVGTSLLTSVPCNVCASGHLLYTASREAPLWCVNLTRKLTDSDYTATRTHWVNSLPTLDWLLLLQIEEQRSAPWCCTYALTFPDWAIWESPAVSWHQRIVVKPQKTGPFFETTFLTLALDPMSDRQSATSGDNWHRVSEATRPRLRLSHTHAHKEPCRRSAPTQCCLLCSHRMADSS